MKPRQHKSHLGSSEASFNWKHSTYLKRWPPGCSVRRWTGCRSVHGVEVYLGSGRDGASVGIYDMKAHLFSIYHSLTSSVYRDLTLAAPSYECVDLFHAALSYFSDLFMTPLTSPSLRPEVASWTCAPTAKRTIKSVAWRDWAAHQHLTPRISQ